MSFGPVPCWGWACGCGWFGCSAGCDPPRPGRPGVGAGEPRGGWRAQEKLTLGQALHAFTRGAAYAGFTEKTMGAIEPGKWADFLVVDRDPTAVTPQALGRTVVLETWVGGEKAFGGARPTGQ